MKPLASIITGYPPIYEPGKTCLDVRTLSQNVPLCIFSIIVSWVEESVFDQQGPEMLLRTDSPCGTPLRWIGFIQLASVMTQLYLASVRPLKFVLVSSLSETLIHGDKIRVSYFNFPVVLRRWHWISAIQRAWCSMRCQICQNCRTQLTRLIVGWQIQARAQWLTMCHRCCARFSHSLPGAGFLNCYLIRSLYVAV